MMRGIQTVLYLFTVHHGSRSLRTTLSRCTTLLLAFSHHLSVLHDLDRSPKDSTREWRGTSPPGPRPRVGIHQSPAPRECLGGHSE